MAIPASEKRSSAGNIFIRTNETPTFFVETVTVTNATTAKKDIVWPAGTPLTNTNATAANALLTWQKMVYTEVRLPPGVPTKVAVVDSKTGANDPGNRFKGLRINVSRLPLKVTDIAAAGSERSYLADLSTWKTALNNKGIAWFEESLRYDPSNS